MIYVADNRKLCKSASLCLQCIEGVICPSGSDWPLFPAEPFPCVVIEKLIAAALRLLPFQQ